MLTPNEIRNVNFSKSVGGYKQIEVESYLEELANQVETLVSEKTECEQKIADLSKKLEDFKETQDSVQSILVSAQRVADQLIKDATEKSEQIVNAATERASDTLEQAQASAMEIEKKSEAQKKSTQEITEKLLYQATAKSESMISGANDSIARQQALFEKVKLEIANFKKQIISMYKNQLELIAKLPDEVPTDPNKISELISLKFDQQPNLEDFISKEIIEKEETTQTEQSDEKLKSFLEPTESNAEILENLQKIAAEENGFNIIDESEEKLTDTGIDQKEGTLKRSGKVSFGEEDDDYID